MEALELSEEQTEEALTIQGNIARAAKEVSPDERLKDVQQTMTTLLRSISDIQNGTFASAKEEVSSKKKLLSQISSKSREVSESTKEWKQFKQQGRAALPLEIQPQYDRLWEICAQKGLFINSCGELESMLAEYGIPPTTDKRAWIRQALKLLPNFEVNDDKYPWKLLKAIHDYLLDMKEV